MSKNRIIFLVLLFVFLINNQSWSQTTRFFRFTGCFGNNPSYWQDTSFIAWTSDPAVISDALDELSNPVSNRTMFPAGDILPGNGGFNCNDTFCYSWHFDPTDWVLTSVAAEVCDACPYSGAELNVQYFLNDVGQLCPWEARIAEELPPDAVGLNDNDLKASISVFPNPSRSVVNFSIPPIYNELVIRIIGSQGREIFNKSFVPHDDVSFDVSNIDHGVYIAQLNIDGTIVNRRIIIE